MKTTQKKVISADMGVWAEMQEPTSLGRFYTTKLQVPTVSDPPANF